MDGWMDGWMDGEVLIIGMMVGWSGGVPKGLPSGLFPLICIASFFEFFFRRRLFSYFFDVGSILGGFGRPKRRQKSSFGRFFFDVFFECVSASIFRQFLEARNLKISDFPIGKPQIS